MSFFRAGSGRSMARLCAFIITSSTALAIDYLAFVYHIFNTAEAVAIGSITTMCAAVWWKSKDSYQKKDQ